MSQSAQGSDPENPFSVRRVRPGAIPYFFPTGLDAETLIQRLADCGDWGQIVGPHGSGKSALFATLMQVLQAAGRPLMLFELHDAQRRMPSSFPPTALARGALILVDGYEQLSRFHRFRLRRTCRQRGWGLVVTTHVSSGFPDLIRVTTSLKLARRLVDHLIRDDSRTITEEEIASRFEKHQGNLREVLFDLYDLCESRSHLHS